jgi:AraC-like DNA-binding protein
MHCFKGVESFGVVGYNHTKVDSITKYLSTQLYVKPIFSLKKIEQLIDSFGAIAYVMDKESQVHYQNLEQLNLRCNSKPLYIFTEQISIPILHQALRLKFVDVIMLPLEKTSLSKLLSTLNNTTDIDCYNLEKVNELEVTSEKVLTHPLNELFELIEQQFTKAPSLKEVSNFLCLSPSRISHMFKDLCGIGFSQYILCRRLEQSEYLLRENSASITNISFELGFSNPSHFCRNFKEHIGITPTAYMKKNEGIKLSCLYNRYQHLRMELLPVFVSECTQAKRDDYFKHNASL